MDNDGDRSVDEGTPDTDGDGLCDARDTETCDGLDNDGDGSTDEGFDSDADGTADCFDSEDCDGVDNDGDGVVDNDTVDTDGDGTCDDRDCVTLFQAEAMGWLTWTSAEGGDAVLIENSGDADVCIDDQALYNSNLTQPFMVDEANLDNVLSPGDSLSIYYGSWAMPNGVYQPFYGSEAWWCVNISTPYMEGEVFEFLGEGLPEAIRHLANDSTDEDNDGREDHTDWSTGNGNVQTQMNIWAYQRSHSSLTAGKIAAASGSEVEVILTSQNIGRVAGSGVLTDSIPAGWTVTSVPAGCSLLGSSLSCNVSLAGAGTTFARRQFVYTIRPDSGLDTPYLELAEAMIDYSDGSSAQTSWSLPAAVYEADTDGSGSYTQP